MAKSSKKQETDMAAGWCWVDSDCPTLAVPIGYVLYVIVSYHRDAR